MTHSALRSEPRCSLSMLLVGLRVARALESSWPGIFIVVVKLSVYMKVYVSFSASPNFSSWALESPNLYFQTYILALAPGFSPKCGSA